MKIGIRSDKKNNNKNLFRFEEYKQLSKKPVDDLLLEFKTSLKGLPDEEREERIEIYGTNEPGKKIKRSLFVEFISKFTNPLVIVLLIIATVSIFLDNKLGAYLIYAMATISVALSFFQEHKAGVEAEKLSEMVSSTASVYSNGQIKEIKISEIVPGDVVYLSAGDMVPADLRILTCKDLFINQSSLTGESYPVEKFPLPDDFDNKNIAELKNIIFMGTSVLSGTALALVLKTGTETQFGEITQKLTKKSPETSFDKGIKKYTWLMIRLMLIMVILIFTINAIGKGNILEALLFSVAVAIGLTPEMLPMLVALNLSKGAMQMSKKRVIVKRLNSIQNFGAMNILCTDKTGTLTLDKIVLEKHCDVNGQEDEEVLEFTYINSFYQTGLRNILDRAILEHAELTDKMVNNYKKIDEIPFDFNRKVMSVIVEKNGKHILITKGRPDEIIKRCNKFELDGMVSEINDSLLPDLKNQVEKLNTDGFRTVAIGYKEITYSKDIYNKEDESELILKGYVAFLDPPKPGVKETLKKLESLNIELKILTGDNALVARNICDYVELKIKGVISGDIIENLNDIELQKIAEKNTIFTRLTPTQKERIIKVLQAKGNTVGYLGDGINDAPALKAADVGISVNNAVDIAKETADIILLEKDLTALEEGIIEGRRVFGNIIKYIRMGSSSNFGNMVSPTIASIFLPFLPMLPIQILLNNFLYDISQFAIPSDNVDTDYLKKPKPWNIKQIQRFMLIFGPISSIFDLITFTIGLLLRLPPAYFHTFWFLESLTTQTLVIFVIRTSKTPFFQSKPNKLLMFSSFGIVTLAYLITYTAIGKFFGFVRLPYYFIGMILLIVIIYLFSVELIKFLFNKKFSYN